MASATVTLLFCDLVDSTALQTRLGDESTDPIRHSFLELMTRSVTSVDGTVVKTLGDGLMASFSSAAAACSSASKMQHATQRLAQRSGLDLHLRVGMSIGEVARVDDDWFGTAVVEAARLCQVAKADQILATDLLLRIVSARGRRDAVPAGPLDLKGLAGPVDAYDVPWRDDDDRMTPSALAACLGQPFHGRRRELDALAACWSRAAAGVVGVVLLEGEAGTGKTTLVANLAREIERGGGRVLYGGCDRGTHLSYGPVAEALTDLFDEVDADELRLRVGPGASVLARLAPSSRSDPEPAPDGLTLPDADDRPLLFEAVARLLAAEASVQPLLLVLDDLQWAAEPSLAMLRQLLRTLASVPLLVVASYRGDDVDRDHGLAELTADADRFGHPVERISLAGLAPAEAVALGRALATQDLDDESLQALAHATAGNPFFLEEMIRHVETDDPGSPLASLPASVRDVVLNRVSTLGRTPRAALDVAAVIGSDVDVEVLASTCGVDGFELAVVLDELVDARLVVQRSPDRVGFAHDLVRSALLGELGPTRGALLHRQVGKALATGSSAGVDPATVADHLIEGLDASVAEEAATWCLRAGRAARSRLAHEDAARHLRNGVEALGRVSEPPLGLRADLRLSWAEVCGALGDAEELRRLACAAASDARQLGDGDRLTSAALLHGHWVDAGGADAVTAELLDEALRVLEPSSVGRRARVLASLSEYRALAAGDQTRARSLAVEAERLARQAGDVDALADALKAHVVSLVGTPDVAERLQLARRLDELIGDGHPCKAAALRAIVHSTLELGLGDEHADALGRLARLGDEQRRWSARIWAAIGEGCRSVMSGDIDRAEELVGSVEREATGHPTMTSAVLLQRFALEWSRGGLADIVDVMREVDAGGAPFPAFRAALALALVESGDLAAAEDVTGGLVASGVDRLPRDQTWTGALAALTEVTSRLGLVDAAEPLAAALAPHRGHLVVVGQGVACLGAIDRYLGMLARLLGDERAAAVHLDAAVALETRLGAVALVERSRRERERCTV